MKYTSSRSTARWTWQSIVLILSQATSLLPAHIVTLYSLDRLSSSQELELHSTAEHLAEIMTQWRTPIVPLCFPQTMAWGCSLLALRNSTSRSGVCSFTTALSDEVATTTLLGLPRKPGKFESDTSLGL